MSLPALPLFLPAGGIELLILFALIILFFGASKLPELARAAGKSATEFERAREESDPDNN